MRGIGKEFAKDCESVQPYISCTFKCRGRECRIAVLANWLVLGKYAYTKSSVSTSPTEVELSLQVRNRHVKEPRLLHSN